MSAGLTSINGANTTNIDENYLGYSYLGKYQIGASVSFSCIGMPQIYFDIPYQESAGEAPSTGGQSSNILSFLNRYGVALMKLTEVSANYWTVEFINSYSGDTAPARWFRVFGATMLNNPASGNFGLQVFNGAGQKVFDSNHNMLKLAGNTYDTEIVLPAKVPGYADDRGIYDTSVSLPFNLQGKSICANTRGRVSEPYIVGGYVDFDTGQTIDVYWVLDFYSLYWASGNTLICRRVATGYSNMESSSPVLVDNSKCQTVYSRLSVIDNSRFP